MPTRCLPTPPRSSGHDATSDGAPLDEVADFEEYTHLYRESWSNPDIRWLLSTVPSTMIFDDHEVHDDWNISDSWIEEMRAKPWWRERVTGAFMAYFLYQHLGNLSPPELAEESLFHELQRDDDGGPRLRERARRWDEDRASSRWTYYRDFGRSRLLVLDSRAARIVVEGRRQMMAKDEWDWIVEHAHGSFDHLVIATSLPVFLAPGIHHLEAWNEAICDGAWGSLIQRLGERLRRAVDLEHWAAYQLSFRRLVDLLCSVSLDSDPPRSITILSGDVHTTYIADVDLGGCLEPCAPGRVLPIPQSAAIARAARLQSDRVESGGEDLWRAWLVSPGSSRSTSPGGFRRQELSRTPSGNWNSTVDAPP